MSLREYIAFAGAAAVVACHHPPAAPDLPFRVSLTAAPSAHRGGEVQFHLLVTNVAKTELHLSLIGGIIPADGIVFDVLLVAENGQDVWRCNRPTPRYSGGLAVVTVAGEVEKVLSPNEVLDLPFACDTRDSAGVAIPAGNYRAIGILPRDGEPALRSPPARFKIEP